MHFPKFKRENWVLRIENSSPTLVLISDRSGSREWDKVMFGVQSEPEPPHRSCELEFASAGSAVSRTWHQWQCNATTMAPSECFHALLAHLKPQPLGVAVCAFVAFCGPISWSDYHLSVLQVARNNLKTSLQQPIPLTALATDKNLSTWGEYE